MGVWISRPFGVHLAAQGKAVQRAKREARRELAENLNRWRREQKLKEQQKELEFEQKAQEVLARPPKGLARRDLDLASHSPRVQALLQKIRDLTPRLMEHGIHRVLDALDRFEWVRPASTWKPQGKSPARLTQSLLAHLLARYPTPPFLWSAFLMDPHDHGILDVVAHIARGGSMYDKIKSKTFPVPFTRAMCHDFLDNTTEYTFVGAVRRTQVRTFGGDARLLHTWLRLHGEVLNGPEHETFWASVLQFLARNPMVDHNQLGPLMDYLRDRYHRDRKFSMKGRTVLALLRDMEEWHRELQRVKVVTGATYQRSGFQESSYERDYSVPGGRETILWKFKEILSAKELSREGQAMKHCVYSYAHSIEKGLVSIWSLTAETMESTERRLTIEVANKARSIVQYRGKYNARAETRDFQILQLWAGLNNLQIMSSRW